MSQAIFISRRVFLKLSATAGAGLLAGISLIQSCSKDSITSSTASPQVNPDLWVRIDSDNSVSIIIPKSEMGQGIVTSLAMLVVEELGADYFDRRNPERVKARLVQRLEKLGFKVTLEAA